MLKDAPPEDVVAAVRIVANDVALLAPSVDRSSRSSPANPRRHLRSPRLLSLPRGLSSTVAAD